jgi:nitrite reductase/ring-hydroxylating ferredoxin subunit
MNDPGGGLVYAGKLEELRARRCSVMSTPSGAVLIVADGDDVVALDNRCPHMGFPLHRGSIEDGILTCHWHHARFDLRSGSTFDLWADDVPVRALRIVGGEVWVAAQPAPRAEAAHWRRRLHDGLAHNLSLVIGKSVLGAGAAGVAPRELVRDAVLYGAVHRDRWGAGLTTLMALADLIPVLDEDDRYLALFHGIAAVADDCEGEAPRTDSEPLGEPIGPHAGVGPSRSLETLARWFRHWVRVRHRTGAERTLRTAIAAGASPQWLAATTLSAVTDRYFADGGHALDFLNKAFEALDLLGREQADAVLPAIVPVLTASLGSEESDSWRHPVDLVALAERAVRELPETLSAGRRRRGVWADHAALGRAVLGEEPQAIIAALLAALRDGATPADVARAVAFAAALRIAHFATSNDHSDWESAHHTFSYANAAFGLIARATAGDGRDNKPGHNELLQLALETEALCLRAALHGALAVYLDRYLNVPPARLPGADDLSSLTPAEVRRSLLDALDRQQQVAAAARVAAAHLAAGYPAADLIAMLGHALLREDAGFHMVQNLQAAVQQYMAWKGDAEAAPILIAAARYLAAHAPTPRARHQTAQVARRLMRGGALHEQDGEADV